MRVCKEYLCTKQSLIKERCEDNFGAITKRRGLVCFQKNKYPRSWRIGQPPSTNSCIKTFAYNAFQINLCTSVIQSKARIM